jgi:hypothetical protein
MPIAFINLRMVFVLVWTIGDASSLACQSLNQVHFIYSSMSGGLLAQSKFNSTIRCGSTEILAMEPPPRIFGFRLLPSLEVRSGTSFYFFLYIYIYTQSFWKLSEY